MPTKREREYYRMGFEDGRAVGSGQDESDYFFGKPPDLLGIVGRKAGMVARKPKRKLSAWNKFVKANSRKKEFRYRDGKLNLKKMGVAFRRKKRR